MSQSPIRILFVIPTLDQSGAEKQLTLLATELCTKQYEPCVIALNRGGPYENELKKAGITVQILNKRLRFDPIAHKRLGSAIADYQPDIVHSWLFSANSHVRLLKNAKTNWKCVVSERCVDSWKSRWQLWLDRKLISKTDALIANSQSVADFYEKVGVPEQSLHVINNGILLPELTQQAQEKAERAAWLKKWDLPEDAFVVGFAGRLAKQKQLQALLWAAHLLKLSNPNVYAMFAGEGPQQTELEELTKNYDVESHVRFVGHQQNLDSFYQQWNAFWLASEYEGQSNSLMEAMAHQIPVIVSDIPANLELVENEKTGLTAPLGNSPAFAKQIRKLINDAELQKKLGTAARNFIAKNRSIELMVNQHDQLYQSLLKMKS